MPSDEEIVYLAQQIIHFDDPEALDILKTDMARGETQLACQIINESMLIDPTNLDKIALKYGIPADMAWDCIADHPPNYSRSRLAAIEAELLKHEITFKRFHQGLINDSYAYVPYNPITCFYWLSAAWLDATFPNIINDTSTPYHDLRVCYEDEPKIHWKNYPTLLVVNVPILNPGYHERGRFYSWSGTNRVDVSNINKIPEAIDLLINHIVPQVQNRQDPDINHPHRVWRPTSAGQWEADWPGEYEEPCPYIFEDEYEVE
jgi:hypothetical protein